MGEQQILKNPIHEAVVCILSCSLQADSETQRRAQDRKRKLEAIEDYPIILTDIIGSDEALAEKHMASVLLKNYLEEIYMGERNGDNLHRKSLQKKVCLNLLKLLRMNFLQIKTMVSVSLAFMGAMDMADVITSRLVAMLKSPNEEIVFNAVFLLKHMIVPKFFNENSGFDVDEFYFDYLLDIFNKVHFTAEIRYSTVPPLFVMLKCSFYPGLNKTVFLARLTQMSEAFDKALREPHSPQSDYKFKGEIIKCLCECVQTFTQHETCIAIPFPSMLPSIGHLLTQCCEHYKAFIREAASLPKDVSDNDDDPTHFTDLVSWILMFIQSMVDRIYFDILIDDLENLLYCLLIFMAPHVAMEAEIFLEDHEKTTVYPIRNVCAEIIQYMLEKIEGRRRKGRDIFFGKMHSVYQRLINEVQSHIGRSYYQVFFARISESLMYGLGLASKNFRKSPNIRFPVSYFIDNWTNTILVLCESPNPMLNGRLLWLGGRYSAEISSALYNKHLKTIIENLNGDMKYLYIPTMQALISHLESFNVMNVDSQFLTGHFADDIIRCVLNSFHKFEDYPALYLNAIGHFVKHHSQCAFECIQSIQDVVMRTFYDHSQNVEVVKEIHSVIQAMACHDNLKQTTMSKIFPLLLGIVHNTLPKEVRDRYGTADKALDLINTFILYSQPPLPDLFLLQAFCGATSLIDRSFDTDFDEIDEAAGNLLLTLMVKLDLQLKYLRNEKGRLVLECLPNIIEKILRPDSRMQGFVRGKLTVFSIYYCPEIIMDTHFEPILRNIITINTSEFSNKRSSWLIFLFVATYRPFCTINYLSNLPGPSGGSALQFMLEMWMSDWTYKVEKIERNIIVLSLVSIIQNCLEHEADMTKLKEVTIKYERNSNKFDGIEYLYYLLVSFLLCDKFDEDSDSEGSAELTEGDLPKQNIKKYEFINKILFLNHPLNVEAKQHVATFLRHGTDAYFKVLQKMGHPNDVIYRLKQYGCAVPEVQEHME